MNPGSHKIPKPQIKLQQKNGTLLLVITNYYHLVIGELYVEPAADRRFASCMAYSTSHYRTFDGLFYTFEGQCTYTMMSTAGLAVEIDNSDCNEQTCSRV